MLILIFEERVEAVAARSGEEDSQHRDQIENHHLALLPAEAVSDAGVFIDDLSLTVVERTAPMPLRLSYNFTDALGVKAAA